MSLLYVQANEQLQARLEALRSQPSALVQAQAKQEEHVRDRDKFRTLIDNLQVCLATRAHMQSSKCSYMVLSNLCCLALLDFSGLVQSFSNCMVGTSAADWCAD